MKARGKREAQRNASPLVIESKLFQPCKGVIRTLLRPFRPRDIAGSLTRGDAFRYAHACPWLSYSAPLALRSRLPLAFISAPLALRSRLPLAFISAPLALRSRLPLAFISAP